MNGRNSGLTRPLALAVLALVALAPSQSLAACASPSGVPGEFFYNADFKVMQYCDGTDWISMSGGGAGSGTSVTDGNKGDLTVSGIGATWTVNPAAIQYSKIQNVGATSLLGRYSGSAGSIQEITLGSGLSLNATTGVLSATGALAGSGSAGYVPYWTSATALGFDNTAGGQFYWDATNHRLSIGSAAPTQALDVTGKITANSVIVKITSGADAPANVGIGSDMSTGRLLGRSSAGTGPAEEITVGSGLTLAGGTLSAGAGGSQLTPSATEPVTCDAAKDGTLGLTSVYTTCVCRNGTGWVSTVDGSTACAWDPYDVCAAGGAGTVCADGSVYAGLSPDGNVRMFTTRCDYGRTWNGTSCTGTRGQVVWSPTSSDVSGVPNCTSASSCVNTGEANTLAMMTAGAVSGSAAYYCSNLVENGQDDWYLPALPELNVVYTNRAAGALSGTFDVSGSSSDYYWSSSENNSTGAWTQNFGTGVQGTNIYKGTSFPYYLRCVRK